VNRAQTLVQTPLFRILRFDHPAEEVHRDPVSELPEGYAVNFIESGSFELTQGRRSWRLTPSRVLLSRPGIVRRYRHPAETPDDVCTSVQFVETLGEQLWVDLGRRGGCPVRPLTNRLVYLRWRVLGGAGGRREPLASESAACDLFRDAFAAGFSTRPLHRGPQLTWYSERIERLRELLEERYAESHSLAGLAREIGMSPFHMARIFKEFVGRSPHCYLLDARLSRAALRLREGASVTETCYSVGFSDLSHFTRSFRRKFGVPPSQVAG
jgi:AraC family transcriptional regulator